MQSLRSSALRTLTFVLMAAGLAACASPSPATALDAVASATPPRPTATPEPSFTASQVPASLTPTASPTPVPQPIGFKNASRLQIIAESENYDQQGDIFAAAISPDGRLAGIAGCLAEDDDMQCHGTTLFRIFDAASGAALFDPEYLSPAIELLAFSPDGSVLAAAGCDINLWIYGLPDTICDSPRAWLIDTQTGELIAELTGYTSHVTDFVFSPDGSTLFTSVVYFPNSGDGDHVIRVYDTHTGEKLATVETGMIYCTEMLLGMSPDGRYLVGNVTSPCGTQSFVGWWDVTDPRDMVRMGTVDSYGRSQVSPDSTQILVLNQKDHTLRRYDLATGESLGLVPNIPRQSQLIRFEYLNDNQTAILSLGDEYAVVDLSSGEVLRRILPGPGQTLQNFILTPDRSTLIRTFYDQNLTVEFIDLATWEAQIIPFDPINAWFWSYSFSPSRMAFLPDGTGMVGTDGGSGGLRFQTLGFAEAGQEQAAQALRHYFDLLVAGDYETTAQMYVDEASVRAELGQHVSFYSEYPVSYVQTWLPDLDYTDMAGLFEYFCQDPEFPCMPVREVLYQARLGEGLYRFTVVFALPDGSPADWPLCASVPADHFCWHRGGVFEYYVFLTPDGEFKVVEGLPPGIGLHVE